MRKPQEPIECVKVTDSNMREVAKWCRGEVHTIRSNKKDGVDEQHVKVNVQYPRNERQTKAFIGDWILRIGYSFKIYVPLAFTNSFEQIHKSPSVVTLEEGQTVDVVKNVFEENAENSNKEELDRNARGYGFEVGRGHALTADIETLSDDNPFVNKNWRDGIEIVAPATEEKVEKAQTTFDDPFINMTRAGEKKDS